MAARSSVRDSAARREVSDTSRLAWESTPACWAAAAMLVSRSTRRGRSGVGGADAVGAGTAAVVCAGGAASRAAGQRTTMDSLSGWRPRSPDGRSANGNAEEVPEQGMPGSAIVRQARRRAAALHGRYVRSGHRSSGSSTRVSFGTGVESAGCPAEDQVSTQRRSSPRTVCTSDGRPSATERTGPQQCVCRAFCSPVSRSPVPSPPPPPSPPATRSPAWTTTSPVTARRRSAVRPSPTSPTRRDADASKLASVVFSASNDIVGSTTAIMVLKLAPRLRPARTTAARSTPPERTRSPAHLTTPMAFVNFDKLALTVASQ